VKAAADRLAVNDRVEERERHAIVALARHEAKALAPISACEWESS
jgi:hypothetical protein